MTDVALSAACQASTELDMIGRLGHSSGWWFISNAAGVVIGAGRTCLEAVEDFLGPVQVNP